MFDPDYRTKGWNQSKYAPKNFGRSKKGKKHTPITDMAIGFGGLAGVITYWLTTQIPEIPNWQWQLGISGGVWVTVMLWLGTTLYSREAKRIDRKLNPEKYAEEERRRAENKKSKKASKSEQIQDTQTTPEITERIKEAGKPIVGSHSTMSARDFEEQIAWLINATTRYRAEVVGGSRDGGVDIKIFGDKRKLVGIVQCKRYSPDKPLAPTHIRALAGVKQRLKVDIAYLATTAYFTPDVEKEAEELGIRLLDGDKVKRMVYKVTRKLG